MFPVPQDSLDCDFADGFSFDFPFQSAAALLVSVLPEPEKEGWRIVRSVRGEENIPSTHV